MVKPEAELLLPSVIPAGQALRLENAPAKRHRTRIPMPTCPIPSPLPPPLPVPPCPIPPECPVQSMEPYPNIKLPHALRPSSPPTSRQLRPRAGLGKLENGVQRGCPSHTNIRSSGLVFRPTRSPRPTLQGPNATLRHISSAFSNRTAPPTDGHSPYRPPTLPSY